MKYLILVVLVALGVSPAATSQTIAEKFGTIAETWDAEISPNGKNLALGCSPNGVKEICIYPLDSNAKPRLIPAPEDARITDIYWANDQFLLFAVNKFEVVEFSSGLRDTEISRLLSYDMDTGKSQLLMRNARSVTNTTNIVSFLTKDPKKILMALVFDFRSSGVKGTGSRLDKSGTADNYFLYEVDLKSGKAKVKESAVLGGIVFDETGKKHATILRDFKDDYFAVKSHRNNKVVFEDKDAALAPFYVEGLTEDRSHLIVDFDKGSRDGLYTLSLTDGAIESYKVNGVEIGDPGLIEDDHRATLVGYYGTDDTTEALYIDPQLSEYQQKVRDVLKVDNVWLESWTADRSDIVVSATRPGKPTQYYIYNPATPSLSPIGGEAPWLDNAPLGDVEKITYAARDGLEIPAYLTLPPGKTKADGPFPLVLLPHGGPQARDTADYDWLAQAIVSQGYAVLQPNFRGSAGYGAKFRNAGFGEFGGKMVTDVLDGAVYLESEGLTTPGGHCALGASYGGYSSLMMALLEPEKTGCVISINGVTDPVNLLRDGKQTSDYWEQYIGDFFEVDGKELRSITPVDRATDYMRPILLIHGEEDTTVPFHHSSRLARGADNARLVTLEADDHYLGSTASRKKVIEESLAFLAAHHPAK